MLREKRATGAEALVVPRRMVAKNGVRIVDFHRGAEVFASELDPREERQVGVALAATGPADRADFA